MKKIISFIAVAAVVISSCTKQANTASGNNNSNSTIITGNFIITKFTDENSAEDKTTIFNGYSFAFNANGTITAAYNGNTLQGSYSELPSHEGEGAKLTINFSNAPLNQLNKKWQIDLISNSAIHLSDDDNTNEVLQFTAQ